MALDFYDAHEDAIRRRLRPGDQMSPEFRLYRGNGRGCYLEHPQTGYRIYHDRHGRPLSRATGSRIGAALAERLSAHTAEVGSCP